MEERRLRDGCQSAPGGSRLPPGPRALSLLQSGIYDIDCSPFPTGIELVNHAVVVTGSGVDASGVKFWKVRSTMVVLLLSLVLR